MVCSMIYFIYVLPSLQLLRTRQQAGNAGIEAQQQSQEPQPSQSAQAAVSPAVPDPIPPSLAAQPTLVERLARDPQIALASEKHSSELPLPVPRPPLGYECLSNQHQHQNEMLID